MTGNANVSFEAGEGRKSPPNAMIGKKPNYFCALFPPYFVKSIVHSAAMHSNFTSSDDKITSKI